MTASDAEIASRARTPIHVVGYPKSGTTWLTRLIGDALDSPTGSGYALHDREPATEGWDRPGPYLVLKSHHSGYDLPDHLRPASGDRPAPVIYLVRDIRDVVVSAFFQYHRGLDERLVLTPENGGAPRHALHRAYFRNRILRLSRSWQGGLPFLHASRARASRIVRLVTQRGRAGRTSTVQPIGNWSDHVRSWIDGRAAVVVRYESLIASPIDSLERTFRNLGLDVRGLDIEGAVERQSFARRKAEFLAQNDRRGRALRRGVAGDWKRFLSPSVNRRIVRRHGDTLERIERYSSCEAAPS